MEILDILRSRYTTKTYDSTFRLSDKQLEDIKRDAPPLPQLYQ